MGRNPQVFCLHYPGNPVGYPPRPLNGSTQRSKARLDYKHGQNVLMNHPPFGLSGD